MTKFSRLLRYNDSFMLKIFSFNFGHSIKNYGHSEVGNTVLYGIA